LLGDLRPDPGAPFAGAVDDLRREVETGPRAQLPWLAQEALNLADMICWDALEQGDARGFSRCAHGAVALQEFASSANLLP